MMTDKDRMDWLELQARRPRCHWKKRSWQCVGGHLEMVPVEADGVRFFKTARRAVDAAMAEQRA